MLRRNYTISPAEYFEKVLEQYAGREDQLVRKACHIDFWKDVRFVIDTEKYKGGVPYDTDNREILRSMSRSKHYTRSYLVKRTTSIYTVYRVTSGPDKGSVITVHCLDKGTEKYPVGTLFHSIILIRPREW